MKHGTNVAGPFCCDHVRAAVAHSQLFIPFGNYRVDVLGDGTLIVGHLLCAECASQFDLSVDEIYSGQVWENEQKFPDICPVCAQCYKQWSAQR